MAMESRTTALRAVGEGHWSGGMSPSRHFIARVMVSSLHHGRQIEVDGWLRLNTFRRVDGSWS